MERKNLLKAPTRPVPALQCYLAYISALVAGAAAWVLFNRAGIFADPYWLGLAVTCIATITIWIFSIANGNSSIYDPYWVIAPPILALAFKANGSGLFASRHPRQIIIFACLLIWACRYHFFYAWSGWRTGLVHEDWRYEQMRNAKVPYWLNSLIGMHLFPTILVFFAFAPAAFILSSSPADPATIGIWDIIGTIGALGAVTIELIADLQLKAYRRSEEYKQGGTFRQGLWKYSRHPNYFGEALFWVSMVPFAAAAGFLVTKPLLMLTGPVLMAGFFRFSCRLTDLRSLDRRPGYDEVMEEVSAMIPLPPKRKRQIEKSGNEIYKSN